MTRRTAGTKASPAGGAQTDGFNIPEANFPTIKDPARH